MTRPTIGEERAARGSQHIALCALDVLRADDIDPLTARRRPIGRSIHSCGAEKPRDQPLLHRMDCTEASWHPVLHTVGFSTAPRSSAARRPETAPQTGRSADRAQSRGRVSGRRSALDERVDDALAARRDDADENHVYVLVERLGAANAAAHMSDCVLCERRGRQSQPRWPRLCSTGPVEAVGRWLTQRV